MIEPWWLDHGDLIHRRTMAFNHGGLCDKTSFCVMHNVLTEIQVDKVSIQIHINHESVQLHDGDSHKNCSLHSFQQYNNHQWSFHSFQDIKTIPSSFDHPIWSLLVRTQLSFTFFSYQLSSSSTHDLLLYMLALKLVCCNIIMLMLSMLLIVWLHHSTSLPIVPN